MNNNGLFLVVFTVGMAAVILGILNIILWLQLWKNRENRNAVAPEELLQKISKIEQNRQKLEDQQWGILDKLKDIEYRLGLIQEGGSGKQLDRDMMKSLLREFGEDITAQLKERPAGKSEGNRPSDGENPAEEEYPVDTGNGYADVEEKDDTDSNSYG